MEAKETVSLEVGRRDVYKKKVRPLRSQGMVPGVIFGLGQESVPVQVEAKAFEKVYRQIGGTSVLDVMLDGKAIPVIIHHVQTHHLKPQIIHIDFLKINMKASITVEIPLVMKGVSSLEESGQGSISQEALSIPVKCLPSDIPDEFVIDISQITATGQVLHASDLTLPKGVVLAHESDKDKVLAHAVPIRGASAAEEAEAEQEAPTEE